MRSIHATRASAAEEAARQTQDPDDKSEARGHEMPRALGLSEHLNMRPKSGLLPSWLLGKLVW